MDLVDFLVANSIGGMDCTTLDNALEHGSAREPQKGFLELTYNGKTYNLKCVAEYYTERTDNKKTEGSTKRSNVQLQCALTRDSLELPMADYPTSCKDCHRQCLAMLKTGSLRRVQMTGAGTGNRRRRRR